MNSFSDLDVTNKGQVFTPPHIVDAMLNLRKNYGSVLEPSCGNGAFLNAIVGAFGVEIDDNISPSEQVWIGDFFEYPVSMKFDTIIGNPPYVRFQDIIDSTKQLLSMEFFDKRSNLFLFFIEKCMHHLTKKGEIIFITPRDFIKATSARKLNQMLYEYGSITHFEELGDSKIFNGYSPNCAIWRWELGCFDRHLSSGQGLFNCRNGQIWFGNESKGTLGEFVDVKVGAVSGADDIFANEKEGNIDMVCSHTHSSRKTRRVIYNKITDSLHEHKERLMQRKIKQFDANNWWMWGRNYYESESPRIYVNCKTRSPRPFFVSETTAYDGSVLGVFPKNRKCDVDKLASQLNNVAWGDLGFVCDGRLMFTQRGLVNAPIEIGEC